jgi:peptide/nickel transport system ATP-binding protein
VFEDLDLQLHTGHAGERGAVIGPSGSGKTSLGNVLLGLVKPMAGTVTRAPGLGTAGVSKALPGPAGRLCASPARMALQELMYLHRLPPQALPALLGRLSLDDALLDRRLAGPVVSVERAYGPTASSACH